MTVYEIDTPTLEFLNARAKRIGEDLSQLWFDPFFWHPPKMHQIKQGLKVVGEYRGLMNDDISFMEIRKKGKKRKKYLVKELIGEGQLFPMVGLNDFHVQKSNNDKGLLTEAVEVTGCVGRFKVRTSSEQFHLSNLRLLWLKHKVFNSSIFFFIKYSKAPLLTVFDEYMVRRSALTLSQ